VQQITDMRQHEFNLEKHIALINFQKTLVKIDRNILWNIFYKHSYPAHLVHTINCLYRNNTIQIDFSRNISEEISVNQGVGRV